MRDQHHHRNWIRKFADAFRGLHDGVTGQNSFCVHIPVGLIVAVLGLYLWRTDPAFGVTHYCLLLLCIGGVTTAELMNSAIEWLARAITLEDDENIRRALDIASGAVLMISLVASTVGLILFIPPLMRMLTQ